MPCDAIVVTYLICGTIPKTWCIALHNHGILKAPQKSSSNEEMQVKVFRKKSGFLEEKILLKEPLYGRFEPFIAQSQSE